MTTAERIGTMVRRSPHAAAPRPRASSLRRDALSLLTGLALGAATVFLSRPAQADVIGQRGIAAITETHSLRRGDSAASVPITRNVA